MNFLPSAITEIVGLFVDDWAFALLLVAWVVLVAALAPYLPPLFTAPILFVGLAVLTLIFVVRQARRLRTREK